MGAGPPQAPCPLASTIALFAVPLGIVVSELITRAIQNAFPDDRSARLLAELRRNGSHIFQMVIYDDRIGMFNVREGSFAYGIIRSLVRQIGGTMVVRGTGGPTLTIVLPAKIEGDPDDGRIICTPCPRTPPCLVNLHQS